MNRLVIISDGDLGARISGALGQASVRVVDSVMHGSDELAAADMVIVATGDEQRKATLRRCDETLPAEAVLATTAPGITELAALTRSPARFVGLHFIFNPFTGSCLVEVVKGLETSAGTIEACTSLLKKAGVTAVVVADLPGLVVDRVMAVAINEAALMYTTRVATIEDIDRVARSCLNWAAGPFEFADIIGIDNVVATLEVLSREAGGRFMPCRLLKQMVAAGRLGKRTGKGFYTYGQEGT